MSWQLQLQRLLLHYTKMLIGTSLSVVQACGKAKAFSPASIGNLTLWLDAADSSTITLDGSNNVSQWNDKSGNGYNAAQSDSARRPAYNSSLLNSKGGFVWDGTNDCINVANLPLTPFISFFCVVKTTLAKPMFIEHSVDVNTNDGWYITGSNGYTFAVRRSTVLNYQVAASNWLGANNEIVSATCNTSPSPAAAVYNLWKSGSNIGMTATGTPTVSNTTTTATMFIGGRNNGTVLPQQGNMHEIVIYAGTLSTTNREKIEGYLAHKWGLAGNLPAGHTYKTTPP